MALVIAARCLGSGLCQELGIKAKEFNALKRAPAGPDMINLRDADI